MPGKIIFVIKAIHSGTVDEWCYDSLKEARDKLVELRTTMPTDWEMELIIREISPQVSGSHG